MFVLVRHQERSGIKSGLTSSITKTMIESNSFLISQNFLSFPYNCISVVLEADFRERPWFLAYYWYCYDKVNTEIDSLNHELIALRLIAFELVRIYRHLVLLLA